MRYDILKSKEETVTDELKLKVSTKPNNNYGYMIKHYGAIREHLTMSDTNNVAQDQSTLPIRAVKSKSYTVRR